MKIKKFNESSSSVMTPDNLYMFGQRKHRSL